MFEKLTTSTLVKKGYKIKKQKDTFNLKHIKKSIHDIRY